MAGEGNGLSDFYVAAGALVLLVGGLYLVARRSRERDEALEARSGVVTAVRRGSDWASDARAGDVRIAEQLTLDNPTQLIRTYKARTPADADRLFQEEAPLLAARGYFATQQRWNPGQWRGIDFLGAVVLMLLLVGFLIFVYMIVVKPAGTLVVTYEPRHLVASPVTQATGEPRPSITDRLAALEGLRSSHVIDEAEYADQRRRILAET